MLDDYSDDARRAVGTKIALGRRLQEEFPCLEEDYASFNCFEIIEERGLSEIFPGVDERILAAAVGYAIRGCPGQYRGLIDDRERLEELSLRHMKRCGENAYQQRWGIHGLSHDVIVTNAITGGKKALEQKLGFHGAEPEQRRNWASEAGKKTAQNGSGIHRLTPEQRIRNSSMGGREATLSKGLTPWTEVEKDVAYLLSCIFRTPRKADASRITQILNDMYHGGEEIRSISAVTTQIYYRKKLFQRSSQ